MRTGEMNDMPPSRSAEAGFTLIESLIAIMVLAIGLIAVANLLVVGAASNTIGNHSTNTTAIATETMERLRNIPFATAGAPPIPLLVAGGDLDAAATCNDDLPASNCVRADNFQAVKNVPGVGQVNTTWEVTRIDGQTFFLRVRSESTAALARRRARAEFTSIRSCTAVTLGCPQP